jgi:radical SAM protein with 4Fe4S-binding SPASM domain
VAYRQVIYDLYGRRGGSPAIRFGDPSFGPLIATDDPTTCYRGCSAGAGGLCVVEDGTVLPCRRLPVPVGSVARGTLAEIYHTAPLLRDLRRRELGEPCGTCEDRDVCGGNRCLAYQATGDPLAGDRACIHMPFEEG